MLPSLTLAFLLGLYIGSYLPYLPATLGGLLCAVAIAATLAERWGDVNPRHSLLLYAALLSGVLYWPLATPLPSGRQPLPSVRGTAADLSGRIAAPVQHAPGRETLVVRLERDAGNRDRSIKPEEVRLVWREPAAALLEGDRIRFRARLHPPSGTLNPGGFDYAGYLERHGIDAVATVTGSDAVQVVESGADSWRWAAWNVLDRWRAKIRGAARATLSQPALGLFLGIVIGERGYLDQDLQEWFMATGTIHLLSISGSHLGLVALVGFWCIRRIVLCLPPAALLAASRTATPTKIAILATWPMVLLYALLAGAELATLRSFIMITVAFAALWLGYERHLYHALALAALVIVLHDPRAVFDISFQLSFVSVLVIVHVLTLVQSWDEHTTEERAGVPGAVVRYARDALLISAAVTVATLPLVALYFNQIPWMGLGTNLLAIPVTGALLVPVGLLSAAWTVVTGADQLSLGWLQEALMRGFIGGLRWCAELRGSEWHVAAPTLPALLLFYIALGIALIQVFRGPLRVAAVVIVLSFVCWWGWSPRLGVDGDRWRVTFLDVGQGDSAVLELPDGATVLIDGGARYERFDMGRGVVAPFLWNRGIRHLDHVVGTHAQVDHVGGLVWVLRHIGAGDYWGTDVERQEQFAIDLHRVVMEQGIQEHTALQGQDIVQGSCRLTVLNPMSPGVMRAAAQSPSGSWLNNQSIVSRFQCGTHAILFAADIEAEGLRRLTGDGRTPVTVLKVPHHGAKSSLESTWIKDVHPQHAVISVGRANPYGHPVQAVLNAYGDEQAAISRTDRDGAVWVTGRISSSEIALTRMRDRLLQPVDLHAAVWRTERENWRRLWSQFLDRDPLPPFIPK